MIKTRYHLLIIARKESFHIKMEGLFGDCCHLACFSGLPSMRLIANGSVDSDGNRIFVLEYSKLDKIRWKCDAGNDFLMFAEIKRKLELVMS